jgi:hypothetical protein
MSNRGPHTNQPRRVKLRTISLRIPEDLESAVRSEAARKKMTVSSFIIRALSVGLPGGVELGPRFEPFDFVRIFRPLIVSMLKQLTDKQIRSIADEALFPLLKEAAITNYSSANMNALRSIIDMLARYIHSWPVSVTHFEDDKGEHFLVWHGVSQEWSKLTGETMKRYVQQLGLESKYEATPNATIFTVMPSKRIRH